MFITNFIHYNKDFWLLWGSFKVIFVKNSQNFIKSHLKISLMSQISVRSLWHVCNIISVILNKFKILWNGVRNTSFDLHKSLCWVRLGILSNIVGVSELSPLPLHITSYLRLTSFGHKYEQFSLTCIYVNPPWSSGRLPEISLEISSKTYHYLSKFRNLPHLN